MRGGETQGVVGDGFDGGVEGGRRIRSAREEGHGLAFGVVAAAGEFANDARGRLQRHTRWSVGSGKSVPKVRTSDRPEVQNLQLGRG